MKSKILIAFIIGIIILLIPISLYILYFHHTGLSNDPKDWTSTAIYISSISNLIIAGVNIYVLFLITNQNSENTNRNFALSKSARMYEINKHKLDILMDFKEKFSIVRQDLENSQGRLNEVSAQIAKWGVRFNYTYYAHKEQDEKLTQISNWSDNVNMLDSYIKTIFEVLKNPTNKQEVGAIKNQIMMRLMGLSSQINSMITEIVDKMSKD